jgi:hypothetical protein
VGDAEGEIEFFQDPKRLLAKTGFVSKLKGMSKPLGARESGEKDAKFF